MDTGSIGYLKFSWNDAKSEIGISVDEGTLTGCDFQEESISFAIQDDSRFSVDANNTLHFS